MKRIIQGEIRGTVVLMALVAGVPAQAIEGLKTSVQSPNIVLSWPSSAGETYIVQWRQALESTNDWLTLTDFFPAAIGTNWTSFMHSNQVENSGMALAEPRFTSSVSSPLAKPANGSGSTVPLA